MKNMKVVLLTVGVIILLAGVFIAGQKYIEANKSAGPAPIVLQKGEEKGQILKGQITKYDIGSLTVTLDEGKDLYFSDLDNISVWEIKNGRPQKSDWLKVTVGQKVSLSMDKPGQRLISIIIL